MLDPSEQLSNRWEENLGALLTYNFGYFPFNNLGVFFGDARNKNKKLLQMRTLFSEMISNLNKKTQIQSMLI